MFKVIKTFYDGSTLQKAGTMIEGSSKCAEWVQAGLVMELKTVKPEPKEQPAAEEKPAKKTVKKAKK